LGGSRWDAYSPGCVRMRPERLNDSIYLLVISQKTVLITRWAAHPFLRFMKVKEVTLTRPSTGVGLHETIDGDLFLFVGYGDGFHVIEVCRCVCEGRGAWEA
jgi:hypothetical protein